MQKTIFIDRDGVINWDPIGDYIKKLEDFKYLDGVLESMKRLSDEGFKVIIISNQAGIGDGQYHKEDLDEITESMINTVTHYGGRIDDVYYCLHGKQEGCSCRKPEIGLFEQAAQDHQFNPAECYYIGDKLSDMEAGKRFGMKTILVRTGHGTNEEQLITDERKPDVVVDDLRAAVALVIAE